ncbi:MAG: glycoside hydrolase family 31 protein, partial [Clostridia bacterium]
MSRFGISTIPTKETCIYQKDSVRLSILSPRILRVEFDKNRVFEDRPSQMAINRNFANTKFTVAESGDKVAIVTNATKFVVNLKTLKVEIEVGGHLVKPNIFHNFGGTARTLDGTNGYARRIRGNRFSSEMFGYANIHDGLMSSDGVTVVDDSKTVLLEADGTVSPRKENTKDKYVFAFGDDYQGGLKEYYQLTGFTPLLPKYALGNWWSRYYEYSEKSYLGLMDKFDIKDVPLTVATIDMDWHIVKNVPRDASCGSIQGRGWTGYTFEKEYFPDYKRFLAELKKRGLAITMNLH